MSGGSPGGKAQQSALEQFQDVNVPLIGDQTLDLYLPEYLSDYQAGQESNIDMGPSSYEDIAIDPRLEAAQMGALEQISQMGETGFTPAEQAALRESRRDSASEAQAKSAQLMDEYARRGMGGSGAELAARLQAGQSSADRMSQEGDRLAQMSQERALNAIGQTAALGGQIRGQQFGEQSDVAQAKDAISQFNTANQQNVQQRNVNAANQASLRNLGEKQRIAEAGANTKNTQQQYNKQLLQQKFQNEIQKAGGVAQQYNNVAAAEQTAAANTAKQNAALIGAAGSVMAASDEKVKKDVKPFDVESFLDSLTGVEFHYKEPKKHGKGKQVGVMAQDVEKEAPQLVDEDAEGTKIIDYNKAGGPIFASLAGLHERLRKLEG